MIDRKRVAALLKTPVREVPGCVVELRSSEIAAKEKDDLAYRVEAVTSDKSDCIRKHNSRDRISWRDTDTFENIVSQIIWIAKYLHRPGTIGGFASSETMPGYSSTKSGCSMENQS